MGSSAYQAEPIAVGGEAEAAGACACFLNEEYAEAARLYAAALEREPDQKEWQSMLARAEANRDACQATRPLPAHHPRVPRLAVQKFGHHRAKWIGSCRQEFLRQISRDSSVTTFHVQVLL